MAAVLGTGACANCSVVVVLEGGPWGDMVMVGSLVPLVGSYWVANDFVADNSLVACDSYHQ